MDQGTVAHCKLTSNSLVTVGSHRSKILKRVNPHSHNWRQRVALRPNLVAESLDGRRNDVKWPHRENSNVTRNRNTSFRLWRNSAGRSWMDVRRTLQAYNKFGRFRISLFQRDPLRPLRAFSAPTSVRSRLGGSISRVFWEQENSAQQDLVCRNPKHLVKAFATQN